MLKSLQMKTDDNWKRFKGELLGGLLIGFALLAKYFCAGTEVLGPSKPFQTIYKGGGRPASNRHGPQIQRKIGNRIDGCRYTSKIANSLIVTNTSTNIKHVLTCIFGIRRRFAARRRKSGR